MQSNQTCQSANVEHSRDLKYYPYAHASWIYTFTIDLNDISKISQVNSKEFANIPEIIQLPEYGLTNADEKFLFDVAVSMKFSEK